MLPWNNWFHCIGSTYASWLPGDPRGWRTRHHREHVEGDYKDPPPAGTYDALHAWVMRNLPAGEVVLPAEQRAVACRAMGGAFERHGIQFVDLSVGPTHFHALARFTPVGEEPGAGRAIPGLNAPGLDLYEKLKMVARHFVGIAKNRSARALSDAGLVRRGGVWAVRGNIHPIRDRAHQLYVVGYIRDHQVKEGAAVWSAITEPPPSDPSRSPGT